MLTRVLLRACLSAVTFIFAKQKQPRMYAYRAHHGCRQSRPPARGALPIRLSWSGQDSFRPPTAETGLGSAIQTGTQTTAAGRGTSGQTGCTRIKPAEPPLAPAFLNCKVSAVNRNRCKSQPIPAIEALLTELRSRVIKPWLRPESGVCP